MRSMRFYFQPGMTKGKDVAATLSNYLGVKPPSASSGNPLVEVVGN